LPSPLLPAESDTLPLYIQHICPAEKAILTVPYFPTLFFLAAAEKTTEFPVFETTELLRQLREQYDFILLDCPAGLGDFYRLATSQADAFICVTIPDIAAVQTPDELCRKRRATASAEISPDHSTGFSFRSCIAANAGYREHLPDHPCHAAGDCS